jgi:hypothetical protein
MAHLFYCSLAVSSVKKQQSQQPQKQSQNRPVAQKEASSHLTAAPARKRSLSPKSVVDLATTTGSSTSMGAAIHRSCKLSTSSESRKCSQKTNRVQFSTVSVRSYTVEYDSTRWHTSPIPLPLTLGWGILEEATNTMDEYEKGKRVPVSSSTLSSSSSSSSSSVSPSRSPTRGVKRVSVQARRMRLLSMGYSPAQLDLLE